MRRETVIDFFRVLGAFGHATALVAAAIVVAILLVGRWAPMATITAVWFVPLVVAGLLLAWVSALTRFFVARMRFAGRGDA